MAMLLGYRYVTSLSYSTSSRMAAKVAIVGGGISGSCAAAALGSDVQVTVFDQGRRGPGGRASHRSVRASDNSIIDDDSRLSAGESVYEFDHGCQFFRADSEEMKLIVDKWCEREWVSPWKGSFGFLPAESSDAYDFFGIASNSNPVYVAVGGMNQLPPRLLQSSNAVLSKGTRVCQIKRKDEKWELFGVTGNQAFHDTNDVATDISSLGIFDAVLLTDISSASSSWHRASAGIPDSLLQKLPKKARMPLFSCMIALEKPIRHLIPLDAFVDSSSSSPLWFAACSQSKPGVSSGGAECWTLISTPSYALQEINQTSMRDRETGAFKPQENDYLNNVPGPTLYNAFFRAIESYVTEKPRAVYLQAQRWGSGLPVAEEVCTEIHDVLGDSFVAQLNKPLVHETVDTGKDFVADDDLQLYYAGDFSSNRCPGFEAAALSGFHAAAHIKDTFAKKR